MVVVAALVVLRLLDPPVRRAANPPNTPAVTNFALRDRQFAIAVAVVVIVACVILTQYGIVSSHIVAPDQTIPGFQGRYFLPLLPLTLLGVRYRQTRFARGLKCVVPVLSSVLLLSWVLKTWQNYLPSDPWITVPLLQ